MGNLIASLYAADHFTCLVAAVNVVWYLHLEGNEVDTLTHGIRRYGPESGRGPK